MHTTEIHLAFDFFLVGFFFGGGCGGGVFKVKTVKLPHNKSQYTEH